MLFKNKKEINKLSRVQKRLYEKQLRTFNQVFNNFTDYQLQEIKKLIEKILKERK